MARSWQYPRWRRLVMQITLWLILCGTIGLAELVTRQRSHVLRPSLGQARTISHLHIELPTDWTVSKDLLDSDSLVAREPGRGRVLTIRFKRARGTPSAEEYLQSSGLLKGTVSVDEEDPTEFTPMDQPQMRPILIAGWPGVIARVFHSRQPMPDMPATLHGQYIAVAVMPSQTAIILQLDSPDADADDADALLVEQVAAAMQVPGESPIQNQTSLSLSNGLTFSVPQGCAVLPQVDSNRTDRTLLYAGGAGRRLLIDLAPCAFSPGDSAEEIRTMLIVHIPAMARVEIRPDERGIWRAETSTAGKPNVVAAHMIARANGNSALFIAHGDSIDSDDFNAAFDALSQDITESQTPNYNGMMQTGSAIAKDLAQQQFGNSPGDFAPNQWWLLREGRSNTTVGWMHNWSEAKTPGGFLEMRQLMDKRVVRTGQDWSTDARNQAYQFTMRQSESQADSADPSGHFGLVAEQFTQLSRDQLSLHVKSSQGEIDLPSASAPAAYVPSGWLIAALSHASEPMILQSEAMGAPPDVAILQPMKLIITPQPNTKSADGGKTALRCVRVEISGTGMTSRYYFRPDGSLDNVEYPDDIQQIRSDAALARHVFESDARMAP